MKVSQHNAAGFPYMHKKALHTLGLIFVVCLLPTIGVCTPNHSAGGNSQQTYRWEIVATRDDFDRASHWMSPQVSKQTAFLGLDAISTPKELKFPPDALAQGIHHGQVIVRLLVDEKGEVASVIVDRATSSLFVGVVIDAAKQYRFKPTIINGSPVRRVALIPFAFDTH